MKCTERHQVLREYTPVCAVTCDTVYEAHCLAIIAKASCVCDTGYIFQSL